jgi:predicted secreted protein
MKSLHRPVAASLVVLLAQAASAQTPLPASPQGVLGLSASASIEVAKDLLAVTLATSREGAEANLVQAQLKEALDAALVEAKKAARPGQLEVQTGNFSIFPRYASATSSTKPAIRSWQGTVELVVEGRDMAAIGQLTGRITTLAIARVAYRLSREASQRVEGDVANQAIGAFRAKAALYAKQFGYDSAAVREVTVTTGDVSNAPAPMMRAQRADAASPSGEALSVEPGKAVVSATVNGTVQMK